MLKPEEKNSYQEFLRKKNKFSKKVRPGKKFKDADKDGLCDYEEKIIYGTDPKNPDTDGDGIGDGQEVSMGRNPLGPGRFRDLFIPQAGNNYLPEALKPKRLLFHALSIIAIKAVVMIFIIFYPLSAWLSPDMALAEAKKIIDLTNNLRLEISLPALLENRQLAQAAWQKVEDMAVNQYFAHINPAGIGLKNWLNKVGYKYSVAGENLAVGFSLPEEVVEAWKNSPTHYRNIIDKDFKEIGVAMADGKFSQIDTIYIAQYFGALNEPALAARQNLTPKTKPATVKKSVASSSVLSAKPASKNEVRGVNITEDSTGEAKSSESEILIDQKTTILSIKSDPLNQTKVIQIETTLPNNAVSAEVAVNNKIISLYKELNQADRWSGASIINNDEEKNILNPLIPASISVRDSNSGFLYGKIDWDQVKIIKATPLEHYQLFKSEPAIAMEPIMDLSSLYFKFILLVAIISMLLNIFIEIRKQHPHIIFYSFAFIALLLGVIIF